MANETILKQLNRDFTNDIRHKYKVLIDGLDFSIFIRDRKDIKVSDSLISNSGKFIPNKMNLKFSFKGETLGDGFWDAKEHTFMEMFIGDLLFTDEKIDDWFMDETRFLGEHLRVRDIFYIDRNVKIIGEIDGEEYDVFDGNIKAMRFSKNNTSLSLNVTLKSAIINKYDKKYDSNGTLTHWYVNNNAQPFLSIFPRWVDMLGYTNFEIDEFKFHDGTFMQIPYVEENTEYNIMQQLAEMVRAVGGILRVEGNKIYIKKYTSAVFPTNLIVDDSNLRKPYKDNEIVPDKKKVKTIFTDYVDGIEDIVWALVGPGGGINESRIKVLANTPLEDQDLKWVIKWLPSGLVKDYRVDKVEAHLEDGTPVTLQYEFLEMTNSGGYIKFYNTLEQDVIIKKFHIKGTPILFNDNNSVSFTKRNESEILEDHIITESNKFVQTTKHAKWFAQYIYHIKCETYKEYEFGLNNCLGFMKSGSNMLLRHSLLPNLDLIVTNFDHTGNNAKIKAKTYNSFVYEEDYNDILANSGVTDEMLSSGRLDSGIFDDKKPNPPMNMVLNAHFNAFDVKILRPDDENIMGFYCYYRPTGAPDWTKEYYASTQWFINATPEVTYEVQVTSVNYQGIESDKTDLDYVIPLKLNSDDITYLPGNSPEEQAASREMLKTQLENDVATLQASDGTLGDRITTNEVAITQTETSIDVKIGQYDTDLKNNYLSAQFSSISQNIDSIELSVQSHQSSIDNLEDPTILVSYINMAPDSIKINANNIKIGNGITVDQVNDTLVINMDDIYINATQVVMDLSGGGSNNVSDVVNAVKTDVEGVQDDLGNGRFIINANTSMLGALDVYGGSYGITSYNGTTYENSTKKAILKGGVLEFWEKI